MGEILRHFNIYRNTFDQIKKKYPHNEFTFIELGNFLTDISQFRDPYANFNAKKLVWEKAPPLIRNIIGLDKWIDDLFGKPENRYGHLANYFYNVCRAITHLAFSDDIPKKNEKDNSLLLNEDFLEIDPLPSKEVDDVFKMFFTQYYPHEHLDMPDFNLLGGRKTKNEDKDYDIGTVNSVRINGKEKKVGLAKYLEEQLEYIAEELSEIERGLSETNLSQIEKRNLFVRLGTVLHPIEDYFFHSNYVELNLWNFLQNSRPTTENENDYLIWFYNRSLEIYNTFNGYKNFKENYNQHISRWRRKLIRRLRFPIFDKSSTAEFGKPSKIVSQEAINIIYTGGFGSNDMFHTMISALENTQKLLIRYEQKYDNAPEELKGVAPDVNTNKLIECDLILIKTFFNSAYREELGKDKDKLAEAQIKHMEQVQGNDYTDKINELYNQGYINLQGKESLLNALSIDKQFEVDYPVISKIISGVGGFLIEFLVTSQIKVDESRAKSIELDKGAVVKRSSNDFAVQVPNNINFTGLDSVLILDLPTDNDSSGEEIGNHTLMAKDTPNSQPLYEDANFLAKYASLTIATFIFDKKHVSNLTTETLGNNNISKLDWKNILRQLLRYPVARNDMWEIELLKKHRQKNTTLSDIDSFSTDNKVVLEDVTNSKIKPIFIGFKRVPLPVKKKALEEKYKMLEKIAQEQYKP